MKRILIIIFLLSTFKIFAQEETSKIEIPNFKDEYSNLVSSLENGNTNINYQNFRFSFIESEQFKIANKLSSKIDSLKVEMYNKIEESDYPEIIKITKQILSIDYTDMLSHKILRQTYKILKDEKNEQKYKTIQFGLLKSITNNRNGQTCESGWSVIQVTEEYFILDMLGAKLKSQSIDNTNGICDKMIVQTEEGETKTYYFETSKVFEGYKKLGIK